MTKSKNQTVKLNKVELTNLPNVGVLKVGVAGTKDDKRTNNPGRPVNKKSARYKRLAKQAFYASVNSKFKKGNQFQLGSTDIEKYTYKPSDNGLGCIISTIGGHVCNVSYIGRTKVQGYSFVLGKKVNVELNLKTLKFVSKK
jgi:hypothetical protein